MTSSLIIRLFEHNNWANLQIIKTCAALPDEQLDTESRTTTKGTIRQTLSHLVEAQQGYWRQLVREEPSSSWPTSPGFAELEEAARRSGAGLLALAKDEFGHTLSTKYQRDGFSIEPWVVMVQAINHASEHREQIKSMLSDLGLTPPRIDGWKYGRITRALTEIAS